MKFIALKTCDGGAKGRISLLNIFLDRLLVFPLQMGVTGAALATGISQTVSMLIVLMHFILRKGELRISRYKPEAKLFRKVIFRSIFHLCAEARHCLFYLDRASRCVQGRK